MAVGSHGCAKNIRKQKKEHRNVGCQYDVKWNVTIASLRGGAIGRSYPRYL
jgi:hypothetical protein